MRQPPTAAHLCERFVTLLKKSNKLPQILSDKSALFATHFIALIGVFTGVGTNAFFPVIHRPGPGTGLWGAGALGRLGELQGAVRTGCALVALTVSLLCLRSGKILSFSHIGTFSKVSNRTRQNELKLHQRRFRLRIRKISSLKDLSSTEAGCPGKWLSYHDWKCSKTIWMWHILSDFLMQQVTPEQLCMVVNNCFFGDCSKQPYA